MRSAGLTNSVTGVVAGSWAVVSASYAASATAIAIGGTGGAAVTSSDFADGSSSMTAGYVPGLSAGKDTFTDVPTSPNGAQKMIFAEAVFTPAAPTATWTGAVNGNWDTFTANWTINGIPGDYSDTDAVWFADTNAGSQFAVNLVSTVSPPSVTFGNLSNAYTIGGAGSIGGSGTLTVLGPGTVTLNTANSYASQTVIGTGGTLVIGSAGNLGGGNYAGTIANNGTFTYSGSNVQRLKWCDLRAGRVERHRPPAL